MEVPAIPIDDEARVQELQGLAVLDTEREQRFDDVCELARAIACTEIAVISLVDSRRQWFKSCVGAPLGQQETPRSISFCGYTILQSDPLIIRDTHLDARFAEHPLVQGEPHVRFYAGFPLTSSRGFVVGSLCAISRNPHQLCDEQIESLRRLASLTILLLEQAAPAPISNLGPALPGWEHRPSTNAARLRSLATLINRDQLIQKLDLLFDIETPAQFAIMRCWFRDYDRVNATLGGIVAEQYINEAARRVVASLPPSASVARFADAELLVLLPFVVDEQIGRAHV